MRIFRLSRILARSRKAHCKIHIPIHFRVGSATLLILILILGPVSPLVLPRRMLMKKSVLLFKTLPIHAKALWAGQQLNSSPCPLKKGSLWSCLKMDYLKSFSTVR